MLLLQTNRGMFTLPGDPVGRTHIVQHQIDTGNAAPVKMGVRRQGQYLRDLTDKEVQKMLEQDVVEPSQSAWSSPVVLVRKKMESTGSAWTTGG